MGELVGRDLTKIFPGGARALDGVSFTARDGKVLTLLGPSGCGKSTLLRVVAGLERATSGTLALDGRPLDPVAPAARDVGFVFQNYALYPHLTVRANLGLALEVRRVPRAERDARVRETARLLGIEDLLGRRPAQLSGGQQQRVALGRALVRRPRLLLMDEPLSNLDAQLRETMRGELKTLFRGMGATVIYVTHDQAEAMSLSDEILVLRAGRVLQAAAPAALYARPGDRFTAAFVGSPRMTIWSGRRDADSIRVGTVAVPLPPGLPNGDVEAGIRPEDVTVATAPLEGGWQGEVVVVEPTGAQTLLTIRAGAAEARALVAGAGPIAAAATPGARVWMRWPPERIHWFDARSGQRLEPPRAGDGT
ncbi:MAG: ABC transporter ATP-binding protein [Hyphomicrobiales bacterium]